MGMIQIFFCSVFALLMLFSNLCHGNNFSVGGRDGWVLNPSESYSHWAERNRFQVNDTLIFKFKKGNDSVLLVTKENYNTCNVQNPIESLTEEDSQFKFQRSGLHYFISGNLDHCNKGQKLIIWVLAVRPKKSPPAPAPHPTLSPPPSASPPAPVTSAPAVSPGPAEAPSSTSDKPHNLGFSVSEPRLIYSVAIGVGVFMTCFGSRI
ncbi:unnamed protein product [Amaranthus hypochondriacus]